MDDLAPLRAQMEEKQNAKRELVAKLREHNSKIMKIREEIKKVEPPKREKGTRTPNMIKKQIESLEFRISTSAFVPAQEKALLKQIRELQKELVVATKEHKVDAKLDEQYALLKAELSARGEVRSQANRLSAELEEIYQKIIRGGAEHAKKQEEMAEQKRQERIRARIKEARERRKKEEHEEMKPYMKEYEPYVSLEEIAEIKKKEPEKEEE